MRQVPFGILGLVDERCGGVFAYIDDVTPKAERDEVMARYKQAAGFAIEALNAAPLIIAPRADLHAGTLEERERERLGHGSGDDGCSTIEASFHQQSNPLGRRIRD